MAPDPSTVNWLKAFYRDLSGVNLEDRSDGSSVFALKINGESQIYPLKQQYRLIKKFQLFS